MKNTILIMLMLFVTAAFSQKEYYTAYNQQTAKASNVVQTPSCEDLKDFIIDNGHYLGKVSGYTMDSSWLMNATAYTYEYKTYVIAEIKTNEYSYKGKEYVFCGVPSSNWSNFKIGSYGDGNSYGKRFHKYIMSYQCNCK